MIDIESDFMVVPEGMNQRLAQRAILPLPKKSIWATNLPTVHWKNWILGGENRDDGVDLSSSPIETALKFCYPTLGLASLAVAAELFPDSAGAICTAYGLRFSDRLQNVLERLRQTSAQFQIWVDEKKLSPRDLAPLLSLPVADLEAILEFLRQTSLSRSEATQALEWAVELKMLNFSDDVLFAEGGNWLAALRRLRRPVEAAAKEKADAQLKLWPWPRECEGRWNTNSDQRALHIDLTASTPADLERKLERLREVSSRWRQMESI